MKSKKLKLIKSNVEISTSIYREHVQLSNISTRFVLYYTVLIWAFNNCEICEIRASPTYLDKTSQGMNFKTSVDMEETEKSAEETELKKRKMIVYKFFLDPRYAFIRWSYTSSTSVRNGCMRMIIYKL